MAATSRPPSAGTARAKGTTAIGIGSVTPEVMVSLSCANAGPADAERGNEQRSREFLHAVTHFGANVSSKLRSNRAGSGGGGSGEAL